MPIYEFRCSTCERPFVIQDSLSNYERQKHNGVRCPSCNGADVAPQLGTVGVRTSKKS